jgi:hypothetical protein
MTNLWQWLSHPHWMWHSPPAWPYLAFFFLGAYHGINPGMGWLFAVSLGLQKKSRQAILGALPPLLLGHVVSVGIVVAGVKLLEARLPQADLRLGGAGILIAFGLSRLVRSRHPRWARWVGMQVDFGDLTLWSFLMASAHGAGLMLVPLILRLPSASGAHDASGTGGLTSQPAGHSLAHHMSLMIPAGPMNASTGPAAWLLPVGVHTLGYLVLTAILAFLVYEKLGVAILRRSWFNLDLMWAVALLLTGLLTLAV